MTTNDSGLDRAASPSESVGEERNEATQITLGEGLVDITEITHEGRVGVLFRPRAEHVPFGQQGALPEGKYWPVAGDVVLWVSGAGPGVAIDALRALSANTPDPKAPAQVGAVEDARKVANVFEALWLDAEDETARLASGFWPSDTAIAEAFHEHRRETRPNLPPWSEVMEGSGIWQHSHDFAARLHSLRPTSTPDHKAPDDSETLRANYNDERRQYWASEAQRLAWMVRNLGGNPEVDPKAPAQVGAVEDNCSWVRRGDISYCQTCWEQHHHKREDRPACPLSAHPARPGDEPEPETGVADAAGVGSLREASLEKWWDAGGVERYSAQPAFRAGWDAALASAPATRPGGRVGLAEACEPWSFSTGEPPDYDSPLSGVFGAGMAYTESLLAKLLDVSSYEGGDGSEDFDCDATMTLVNILAVAGLWDKDENRPVATPVQPDAGERAK